MNSETLRELYTVHVPLIFSWSDTCWEHKKHGVTVRFTVLRQQQPMMVRIFYFMNPF